MGILDSIMGRFSRKDDSSYLDVRSHVLGERSSLQPPPPLPPPANRFNEPPRPEEQRVAARYPMPDDRYGPPERPMETEPTFDAAPFERKPLGFDDSDLLPPPTGGFGLEKMGKEQLSTEEAGKNYEIIDRLNIIEAQLQAIRSQTETINERLKNMELRLPRRY
ncbi:MAG: hypothetical protein HYY37_06390 [Candidatus Aenigmarchaeota archaeon]|nr:hypothetical protein [Candidatus Aenigmarchaeota archaeon]